MRIFKQSKIVWLVAAAVAALAVAGSATAASVTATATVSAGTLSLATALRRASRPRWTAPTSRPRYTMPMTANDATGSGAGWNVTITSTAFTTGTHSLSNSRPP